jgi:DNA repair photolyase
MKPHKKGRGAQINPENPFHRLSYQYESELEDMMEENLSPTRYTSVHPKTIVNKVDSPDVPMDYSINPYQGCEHGCVYCYARNTHPYWGYSAGLDFEKEILVKHDAPKLLKARFRSKNWKASPIMLSGNTDCYQPAERKYRITRQLLEVFWDFRHPVGVITKNKLILRDLDILKQLAAHNLVRVAISLTTLDRELQHILEPRTSTPEGRLKAIKELSEAGIPVSVMAGPIIPGLNEHEILQLAKMAAQHGAHSFNHTFVRLNGAIGAIFEDWLDRHLPDRKEKVLNKIKGSHSGKFGDSRFGTRMRGEGKIADIVRDQVQLARKRFFAHQPAPPPYNLVLYDQFKEPQLKLF